MLANSKRIKLLICFLISLASLGLSPAQSGPVKLELVSDTSSVSPGSTFKVSVKATINKDWHIYWIGSGESGLPTEVSWSAPDGFESTPTEYPVPHKTVQSFPGLTLTSHTYEDIVYFTTSITAPSNFDGLKSIKVLASVDWQACKETCLPPVTTPLSIDLPIGPTTATLDSESILSDWNKSQSQLPIIKALARTDFGHLEISSKLSKDLQNQIGKNPYLMLSDSSIIKESDGLMMDLENDVLTLFAPLEDESYKINDSLQGFLLTSDSSKAFWLTTETLTIDETQIVTASSKSYPRIDSPEAQPYLKAIEELTKNNQTKKGSFFLMLFFAFLGGIILNLMPCVFPILGIKILGFVQQSGSDKRKVRLHGWSFASGIFVSLWLLVSVLFLVRNSGQSAGWGFQFQHPWFVLSLIGVMFIFSLNLFGLFEIGTSLTGAGSKLQNKKGLLGSFFSGILAVLVATPCTGPFMGPALGFALSGPEVQGYALFTSLAAGLSLPYIVLSYMPKLVDALPRPGKWMETFKQFMAFPLLATVIWLLNILGKAIGLSSVIWTLLALVILALGLWIYGKYSNPLSSKPMTKWLGRIALLLSCLICFKIAQNVTQMDSVVAESTNSKTVHGLTYEPFDPIVALEHVKNGKNVFIDYTAVW